MSLYIINRIKPYLWGEKFRVNPEIKTPIKISVIVGGFLIFCALALMSYLQLQSGWSLEVVFEWFLFSSLMAAVVLYYENTCALELKDILRQLRQLEAGERVPANLQSLEYERTETTVFMAAIPFIYCIIISIAHVLANYHIWNIEVVPREQFVVSVGLLLVSTFLFHFMLYVYSMMGFAKNAKLKNLADEAILVLPYVGICLNILTFVFWSVLLH